LQPKNVSIAVYTPFASQTATTDILSCKQYAVGSNGTIVVSYGKGGMPTVLIPDKLLTNSSLCGYEVTASKGEVAGQAASGAHLVRETPAGWMRELVLVVVLGICTYLAA